MSDHDVVYKIGHAFGKALAPVAHAFASAFNRAAGNTALAERGIYRDPQAILDCVTLGIPSGLLGCIVSFTAAAAVLPTPAVLVAAPLCLAFGVAAGTVPARLHASYLIGKRNAQRKAAKKAMMNG